MIGGCVTMSFMLPLYGRALFPSPFPLLEAFQTPDRREKGGEDFKVFANLAITIRCNTLTLPTCYYVYPPLTYTHFSLVHNSAFITGTSLLPWHSQGVHFHGLRIRDIMNLFQNPVAFPTINTSS